VNLKIFRRTPSLNFSKPLTQSTNKWLLRLWHLISYAQMIMLTLLFVAYNSGGSVHEEPAAVHLRSGLLWSNFSIFFKGFVLNFFLLLLCF